MFRVLIAKRQNEDGVVEYQVQDYVIKSGYIKSGFPYILTNDYIMNDIKNNSIYKTLENNEFTEVKVGGIGKNRSLTTKKNKTDIDNIGELPSF